MDSINHDSAIERLTGSLSINTRGEYLFSYENGGSNTYITLEDTDLESTRDRQFNYSVNKNNINLFSLKYSGVPCDLYHKNNNSTIHNSMNELCEISFRPYNCRIHMIFVIRSVTSTGNKYVKTCFPFDCNNHKDKKEHLHHIQGHVENKSAYLQELLNNVNEVPNIHIKKPFLKRTREVMVQQQAPVIKRGRGRPRKNPVKFEQ